MQPSTELAVELTEIEEEYSCCDAKLFKMYQFFYDSPETSKWIFTFCLIQIPTILHEVLHLSWFSNNHLFGALYILIGSQMINFWALLNLYIQDPGFIQKIKYGYEIDEEHTLIPKSEHINNYVVISYLIPTKQLTSRLKLCTTCNIYRPNRTSHCNECGVCVERMDHHCPWIGTCVGKRNFKYFYSFLLSLLILIITTMVMCVMIMIGNEEDPDSFGERLKQYPISIILLIIPCLPGLFFVGVMLGFHSYLLATDLTTKEVFDEKWSPTIGNPERKGNIFKNVLRMLFRTQESKSKYKHPAYPYYNQDEAENSSNQKNSDPDSKKKERKGVSESEESLSKNPSFLKPNMEERVEVKKDQDLLE